LIFILLFLCVNVAYGVDNIISINNDSVYLESSKNCQSNSSIIKNLTKNVIKSDIKLKTVDNTKIMQQNAVKIFDYVNKNKSYSFYYNSKHGANKMVKLKSGNCVDKAHLLIAMMRSAKIPARYVHATVIMKSGNTYGHVYAEVKIGKSWIVCDPTHRTLNKFGKTGSWKKQKIINRYNSLPF
jgi:transglutaminase-like putative cysteine protease